MRMDILKNRFRGLIMKSEFAKTIGAWLGVFLGPALLTVGTFYWAPALNFATVLYVVCSIFLIIGSISLFVVLVNGEGLSKVSKIPERVPRIIAWPLLAYALILMIYNGYIAIPIIYGVFLGLYYVTWSETEKKKEKTALESILDTIEKE